MSKEGWRRRYWQEQGILALLNEHGPMTPVEIHEHRKTIKPGHVRGLLGHMKSQGWVVPVGNKKWKAIAEARSETR